MTVFKSFFKICVSLFILLILPYSLLAKNIGIEEVVKPGIVKELINPVYQKGFERISTSVDFSKIIIPKKLTGIKSVEKKQLPEIIIPNVVIDDVIVFLNDSPANEFLNTNQAICWSAPSNLVTHQSSG